MRNIQISFDEDILEEINRVVSVTDLSFSDIVRDAVMRWLQSRDVRKFEEEWIQKLRLYPDNSEEADKWTSVQHWSEDESW